MARRSEDKYPLKREALVQRTTLALNVSEDSATELLSIPRGQSLRINTLKISVDEALASLDEAGVRYSTIPWTPEGVFIDSNLNTVRDSTEVAEGALYIQNAASWLPVLALNPQKGEKVLDMCAAPGGKTSHIAQAAHNEALITANDNSRPRLHKLQNNLARMGVEHVDYLLHDATRLAQKLGEAQFDKILLDAPCSGEGMMTLDNKKDFESWSVAHIKRLQQLQKKLVAQAWQLLKPGGTLVYSTCTMAPEENEAVLDYLLRHNDDIDIDSLEPFRSQLPNSVAPVLQWNGKSYDPRLAHSLRLAPSPHVEAFFVAKLTKRKS